MSDIEPDDATDFAYDIYDRCLAEGRWSYESGEGIDTNPYEYDTFEWVSWREGYDR